MRRLRTLLILGRVSNLPTVWSNCVAGWWLGGAEARGALPLILASVTLLYIGGMYLNDAFDAEFDQQYRRERPIPSGAISCAAVRLIGTVLLLAGLLPLSSLGMRTAAIGAALLAAIVLYDAIHKKVSWAPAIMGTCRFLVYVLAASAATDFDLNGRAIWCGLALGIYVAGLSFLARGESTGGSAPYWPAILLAAPIALALLMNAGDYRKPALLLSAALLLWVLRSVRSIFSSGVERNPGRAISGLLAGIVLVDLLATCDAPRMLSLILLALFGATQLFQRFVPAT